jgi:hypothetical protein
MKSSFFVALILLFITCKGQDLQRLKVKLKSMSADDRDLISTVHGILEIEPFYEKAHEKLSEHYVYNGEEKELRKHFDKFKTTYPDSANAFIFSAIYGGTGSGDSLVLNDIEKALRIDPDNLYAMRIKALHYYRLFLISDGDQDSLKSYYADRALAEMTQYYARSENFESGYAIHQLRNFLKIDQLNDLPDGNSFALPTGSIENHLQRAWQYNYSLDVVSKLQYSLSNQFYITDFFNQISEPNLRNSDTAFTIRFTQIERESSEIVVYRIFSNGDQTYILVKMLNLFGTKMLIGTFDVSQTKLEELTDLANDSFRDWFSNGVETGMSTKIILIEMVTPSEGFDYGYVNTSAFIDSCKSLINTDLLKSVDLK